MVDKEEGFFDKLLSIGEGFMDAFEGKRDEKTSIAKEVEELAIRKISDFWEKTKSNNIQDRDINGKEFKLEAMTLILDFYRRGGENAIKIINEKK